jgi:DNA-binding transcriptional LysR family regulator
LDWRFEGKLLRTQPRLSVTTNDAAMEAALRGFGITQLLSYQVARLLEAKELSLVLEKYEPPPRPIHIVHREGRHASAKVRAFVDLMVERLRADPAITK